MNDKAKTQNVGAVGFIYRVSYNYAAPKTGQLRQGAIIVEAKTAEEAWSTGEARLASLGLPHGKITGAKLY